MKREKRLVKFEKTVFYMKFTKNFFQIKKNLCDECMKFDEFYKITN